MRCELVPESNDEAEILRAAPAIKILLEPTLAMAQARALIVAARLGVFEALAARPCSAADLAAELGLDAHALGLLLQALHGADLLDTSDGQGLTYQLSELASAALVASSPTSLSAWVRFNEIHWRAFDSLETFLRAGRGQTMKDCLTSDDDWRCCQEAMLETARPAADAVAEAVPVPPGARLLLDLGGSHGLYSAAICRRNPPLRAEVVDLPEALPHATRLARRLGIDDVVSHRAGDLLRDELGRCSADVVFLGNVVHHLDKGECRDLLERVAVALRPGGALAIWDLEPGETGARPEMPRSAFSLLFGLTSSSSCHSSRQLQRWMKGAGLEQLVADRLGPTHSLIIGRRPTGISKRR